MLSTSVSAGQRTQEDASRKVPNNRLMGNFLNTVLLRPRLGKAGPYRGACIAGGAEPRHSKLHKNFESSQAQ